MTGSQKVQQGATESLAWTEIQEICQAARQILQQTLESKISSKPTCTEFKDCLDELGEGGKQGIREDSSFKH